MLVVKCKENEVVIRAAGEGDGVIYRESGSGVETNYTQVFADV